MEHSIAPVTGATSGLGYAADSMLAVNGWREILVTGRSHFGVNEVVNRSETETGTHKLTGLAIDMDLFAGVKKAGELVKRGVPIFRT